MADTPRGQRILGLDPGSRFTGFGLVDRSGSRLRALDHGRIALSPSSPLPARLASLCGQLRALVRRFEPDVAVLEALFRGVNARSLIVLAQARGALVATLAQEGVEIHEYSPAEVKAAVTGSGRADKQQVARMVRLILGLSADPLTADESDALAVAICFGQRSKLDLLAKTRGPAKVV